MSHVLENIFQHRNFFLVYTSSTTPCSAGMSEVLGAQGLSKLNELMPKFVAAAQQLDAAPSYRDGYLMLFVYLPVTFGEAFVPFISDVIPPILKVGSVNWILSSFVFCLLTEYKVRLDGATKAVLYLRDKQS